MTSTEHTLSASRNKTMVGVVGIEPTRRRGLLDAEAGSQDQDALKASLIAHCKDALPAHKVPALIKIVPHIAVGQAGKLVRTNA